MEPGHSFDSQIAEKVMGWNFDGVAWRDGDARYGDNSLPRFSTEPGYVWSVVERMERLGLPLRMRSEGLRKEGSIVTYHVQFGELGDSDTNMPMAICKAAVAALKLKL